MGYPNVVSRRTVELAGSPGAGQADALAPKPGGGVLFFLLLAVLIVEFLGLADLVPGLKAVRFSTLCSWLVAVVLIAREGFGVFRLTLSRLLIFFLVFTACSAVYAVVTTYAVEALRAHLDYFILFLGLCSLLDRPRRVRQLAVVLSLIVLILVAANLEKLTSGVRAGAMNGGYFVADGNDFGWALNILLPIALFLALSTHGVIARSLGIAAAAAAVAGIIGTQSRGATLALAASVVYYWLFVTRRKALGMAALVIIVAGVLAVAPSRYFDRMRTIENYMEDNSAQSRLQVWGAAARMAVDFPLGVGAGNFSSAYGRFYIPDSDRARIQWGQNRWLSTHSVYFRLLGEYGVLGVLWFATILVCILAANRTSATLLTEGSGSPNRLPADWPRFLNMSVVGYAVSGVFLGGLTYPYLYILVALTAAASLEALRAAPSSGPARPQQAAAVVNRRIVALSPRRPARPAPTTTRLSR